MSVVNEFTFFPCEHPRLVYNKYINTSVQVSCGYCHACMCRKLTKYLPLIANESASHCYTVFFTLTYNPENIHYIDILTYLPKHYEVFYSLVRQCEDYLRAFDYSIGVVCKSDVQKFVKRLRKLVSKDFGPSCKIRYFINGDYGSTTFRPHFHGLLFFDSRELFEQISSYISRAWSIDGEPLGFIDAARAYGNGSYVASYTAASSNRPIIYDYVEFAPKPLFSSKFGHSFLTHEDCRKIITTSSISALVYDNAAFKYRYAPLPNSLSSRLFPTIPTFHSLGHCDRLSIYRLFAKFFGKSAKFRLDFLHTYFHIDSFFRDYITLGNSEITTKQLSDKFDRVYYTVCRLLRNCDLYGISLNDYDLYIDRYYFNKFNFNMSNQCHFQELLLKNGFSNEDVSLFTNSVDEHFYEVSPRELHPDFFFSSDAKFNSLVKSKLNHKYLESHPKYKQFIH